MPDPTTPPSPAPAPSPTPEASAKPTPITDDTQIEIGGQMVSLRDLKEQAASGKALRADLAAMGNEKNPDREAAIRVFTAQGMSKAEIERRLKEAEGLLPGDDDEEEEEEDDLEEILSTEGKKGKGKRKGKDRAQVVDPVAREASSKMLDELEALRAERLADMQARRDDTIETALETLAEVKSLTAGLDLDEAEDKETADTRLSTVKRNAVARFARKAQDKVRANGGRWNPGWTKTLAIESVKEEAALMQKSLGRPRSPGRAGSNGAFLEKGRERVVIPKVGRESVKDGGMEAFIAAVMDQQVYDAGGDGESLI